MNIIISALPGSGHVRPLIALGLALKSANHTVYMLTSSHFKSLIEQAKINFLNCGIDWSEGTVEADFPQQDLRTENLKRAFLERKLWHEIPLQYVNAILKYSEELDVELCLSNNYDWSGHLAAEILGSRHIEINIAALNNSLNYRRLYRSQYTKVRKALSLEAVSTRNSTSLNFIPHFWSTSQNNELPSKPFFQPLLYERAAIDIEADAIPALPFERSVLVSFGTVSNKSNQIYQILINVCRSLRHNLILLTGPNANLQEQSKPKDGLIIMDYYPLSRALVHSDLMISHGGVSSTLAALTAGVPIMLLPQGADQPINYQVCKHLGVCPSLPTQVMKQIFPGYALAQEEKIDEEVLLQLTKVSLENPAYAEQAKQIAKQIALLPDHLQACRAIEDICLKETDYAGI